jgi:hypothetical protein
MNYTLHKTIKRQWFDMIVSGEKKEEYLDIKKYWINRLTYDFEVKSVTEFTTNYEWDYNKLSEAIKSRSDRASFSFEEFDTVTCRNGYNPISPLVIWEHLGVRIGEGKPEWGAEKGVIYFCLQIGEIKSVTNI